MQFFIMLNKTGIYGEHMTSIMYFYYFCLVGCHSSRTRTMKYLIRAIKYFAYLIILILIMLGILIAIGYAEPDVNSLFRNGTQSVLMILVMLAFLAAIYPNFGFMKKDVIIPGEYGEIRDTVIKAMEERGYLLDTEDGENLTFRRRDFVSKLTRMFEDRITLSRDISGFRMEGLRKDVVRMVYAIENKARNDI